LPAVVLVVLGRVVQHILDRHEVSEVRVPVDREVHPACQSLVAGVLEGVDQAASDLVHDAFHTPATEDSRPAERAEVVDDVERTRDRPRENLVPFPGCVQARGRQAGANALV